MYLHNNDKIHRNISADNILINSKGKVKINNFGNCREIRNKLAQTLTLTNIQYMSPERLTEDGGYSYPADIWSVGIVLYEIVTEINPYTKGKKTIDIMQMQRNVHKNKQPELPLPNNFSEELNDFLSCCLKKDPIERLTIKELCVYKNNFNILGA